ncbi:MAG: ferrochelatase [Rhodospirillaceae bacterium]|nr:ferrochelatase [Rhodospirillaceae bacterium]
MQSSLSQPDSRSRRAIVLCNLGGADGPESVRGFLYNLFSDRNIIPLPTWIRIPLAALISTLRAPHTKKLYDKVGGRSILMEETRAQATALEAAAAKAGWDVKVIIAMNYWHPFPAEAISEIKAWGADEVLVVPLYPQFSTTTSGSVLEQLRAQAKIQGLTAKVHSVCCYPKLAGFIAGMADLIEPALHRAVAARQRPRLLLSAHGLPEKTIARGDPYQWQVEQTAAAIHQELIARDAQWTGLDVVVCYQSRVGPVAWIGPTTEAEVIRAGRDGCAVVLAPIAFVSEHLETVVELDDELKSVATENGVTHYDRVSAIGVRPGFIESLLALAESARMNGHVCSDGGARVCPSRYQKCPHWNEQPPSAQPALA